MAPFLSIVTRHMLSRPTLFQQHCASLAAQTEPDFEHIVIEDPVGHGMLWANSQFALHVDKVKGVYVLMLDDDDILCDPQAITLLKDQARYAPSLPGLILFKVDHGKNLGVLPDNQVWQKQPVFGHIGGSSMLTLATLWKQHIANFAHASGGDFKFLEALWQTNAEKVWLDKILVKVLRTSRGAPE